MTPMLLGSNKIPTFRKPNSTWSQDSRMNPWHSFVSVAHSFNAPYLDKKVFLQYFVLYENNVR